MTFIKVNLLIAGILFISCQKKFPTTASNDNALDMSRHNFTWTADTNMSVWRNDKYVSIAQHIGYYSIVLKGTRTK